MAITEKESYNIDTHMFIFKTSGGTFGCSAADKMVTNSPVSLEKSGEYNVAVYRNGVRLNGIPSSVADAGDYTVITWTDNSEQQLMTFHIVGSVTGKLDQYVMPDGFTAGTVLLDGVETTRNFGAVDMTEEGYYDIRYTCSATNITYNLTVSVDHIPPQVTFDGVDKNNKAKGPVTIQGLKKGDTVTVTRDGKNETLKSGNKLTESGKYTVIVTDNAGNVTKKSFTIMLYLNVKSIVLFAAFLLIIAGVFVALYITRKNLRVR